MDAIAAALGKDRTEVRAANFIQPDEFPYDQGLVFQDGRELEYDSGDYPASLDKLKELVGWDDFEAFRAERAAEGKRVGIGLACYVEGTGVGPVRGRPRPRRDLRQGQGGHRAHDPGAGPPDGVRADRGRRARGAVRVGRGDHRRHPPDAVRRRHLRLPRGRDERVGGPPRGAGGPRRRRCGSRPRRWRRRSTTSRSATAWCGSTGTELRDRPRDGGGAVQPAALRLRRGVQGRHPVLGRRPRQAAGRRGRRAGPGGQGLLLARALDLRLGHARGGRRDRSRHRRGARS